MVIGQAFWAKFFEGLLVVDEALAAAVSERGCPRCRGRLDRADYQRKPRDGGLLGAAGASPLRRISLCCARPGCRARSTPPSVRFLGRRVYFAVVVLMSTMLDTLAIGAGPPMDVPRRTVRRWTGWWRVWLVRQAAFQIAAARFMPPLATATLPASLIERFAGPPETQLIATLRWLGPWTTQSCACSEHDI